MSMAKKTKFWGILNLLVVVAALGYFVDIYDLVLFGMLRVPSLTSLGVLPKDLLDTGLTLLNFQMFGMLVGGIFWGVLGDKKGRLFVLFGSIFTYAAATAANGLVHSVEWYGVFRFLAGFGLAGELGAGITLVSETLPKDKRGYGTTLVASIGIMGALAAWFMVQHFDWRMNYFIGGGLGFVLLFLRFGAYESGLYKNLLQTRVKRGNIVALFTNRERFSRYIRCILVGIPIWFMVGIIVTFSPEFARVMGVVGSVTAVTAIMICYMGFVLGDLASGLISQLTRSRKKVMIGFMILVTVFVIETLLSRGISSEQFYLLCFAMGVSGGYWALFLTVSAEQFGTNLRATVATTVPNFVRGSVVLLVILFRSLIPQIGFMEAAGVTTTLSLGLGFLAIVRLKETFGKDLDYLENHHL